jgi:hypothetical protein
MPFASTGHKSIEIRLNRECDHLLAAIKNEHRLFKRRKRLYSKNVQETLSFFYLDKTASLYLFLGFLILTFFTSTNVIPVTPNFWKCISKILEMDFQFLEMDFQFDDEFQCIYFKFI